MNISDLWHAFVWPILLISLRTFYPYIKSKGNKSFELQTLLIAFVLGWFLYLIIGFRIGSEIFYKYLQLWYSGTLRLVTMLEKKTFITLAASLSLLIILSFLIKLSFLKCVSDGDEESFSFVSGFLYTCFWDEIFLMDAKYKPHTEHNHSLIPSWTEGQL